MSGNVVRPHAWVEKPAMHAMLPDLTGRHVLCLGCGAGGECAELLRRGGRVTGVDICAERLAVARRDHPDATFALLDMHRIRERYTDVDLVYASLSVQYSDRVDDLLAATRRVLRTGGVLQFSVPHPVRWAARLSRPRFDSPRQRAVLGFQRNGDRVDLFGTYLTSRLVEHHFADGQAMAFWCRPPSEYFSAVTRAGFTVTRFVETRAVEAARHDSESYWTLHQELPSFMLFQAVAV
jgi:SAM-dependent methyltransferase